MINLFCRTTSTLLRPLLPRLFSWKVEGAEHVPIGPCILVSNHQSVVDPTMTLMALYEQQPPRHVYFLAKSSLYEIWWVGWLLNQIQAIPLRQEGADLTAFKKALRLLEQKQIVGIYPEGGITWLHEPRRPQPGLALLAHLAQVPVVPVGISGGRPLWWRDTRGRIVFNRMRIRFGPPIAPPPRTRLNDEARLAYTQQVLDECYRLVTPEDECLPPDFQQGPG